MKSGQYQMLLSQKLRINNYINNNFELKSFSRKRKQFFSSEGIEIHRLSALLFMLNSIVF